MFCIMHLDYSLLQNVRMIIGAPLNLAITGGMCVVLLAARSFFIFGDWQATIKKMIKAVLNYDP